VNSEKDGIKTVPGAQEPGTDLSLYECGQKGSFLQCCYVTNQYSVFKK
jgi:hypothetical protein